MKIKLTKVPADSKLKAGETVEVSGAESDTLKASGHDFLTEEADLLIKAREAVIDQTIRASKAFAPKDETSKSEKRELAVGLEAMKAGSGVAYLQSLPALQVDDKGQRLTASATDTELDKESRIIHARDLSLRDTVKGFFKAHLPDWQTRKQGGFVRACQSEKTLAEGVIQAHEKTSITAEIARMIDAGAILKYDDNLIKAATNVADNYADPAGGNPLGVLNTALTLLWNFGQLENQLVMIDDVTTDVGSTPVKFNEWARSRYIKIPGVQVKALGSPWVGVTGNDVDVSILMNNYAGTQVTLENATIGSTARPLTEEQRPAQLYGMAEYIIYTLVNAAIGGTTRFANDGTTTSTIKAASAFIDPSFGIGTFNVQSANLPMFVASLPAAMDMSKFPGGDEAPGAALSRHCWVHTSLYASIAADPAYQLNSTIQGIRQEPGENLIRTGRFREIGNNKFRKSQLVLDNNTTSAVTATGVSAGAPTASILSVVPGTLSAAKVVGIAGTRSGLMFVSRAPVDYTKIEPGVPMTASVELFTSPKIGIPFVIVKYYDHGYETVNVRVQCMWGIGIGDERQLMLLRQA